MKATKTPDEILQTSLNGYVVRYDTRLDIFHVLEDSKLVAAFETKREAIAYCENNSDSNTKQNTSELRTPGEWKTVFYGDGLRIYSENYGCIAEIPHEGKAKEEHEANAEYICAAVNSHESLVDALRMIMNATHDSSYMDDALHNADKLLNKLNS